MNKTYERPVAEVISFEAMEQMASLSKELDIQLADLEGSVDWLSGGRNSL